MRSRRSIRIASLCAASAAAVALALPATPATASTRASAQLAKHSYIVLLRTPSRTIATLASRDAVRASQDAVVSFLGSLGTRATARTLVPDTMTVGLTGPQLAGVRHLPGVLGVFANAVIPLPKLPTTPVTSTSSRSSKLALGVPTSQVCGTARNPQLDPEALTNINAEQAVDAGADGAGVKVAFIADGLDTTNPDFQRNAQFASPGNPTGAPVITNYQDFSTDGTAAPTDGGEAFLDASSIVAQGNSTYDLSGFNPAHPLPAGCDIKIEGDAPGVDLTALKVFSSRGFTTESAFLQAINYAVSSGQQVLNESFGSNPFPDSANDLTRVADDAAVSAGVTVVASSGDAGTDSTIGSPATDPAVIGVGASTTFRSYQQFTYGGINVPGVGNGKVLDNNISSISSGGFAQDGKTVDLVAPGDSNWALCSASPTYADCGGQTLEFTGGTSESSPLTAGAAADVIQAYAQSHHGATPSPALVKHILTSSATDVFAPADEQGAGLLNIGAAVDLARSIAGTTDHDHDGGLLTSTSQVDVTAPAHSAATGSVAVTNTSGNTAVVFPYLRELFTAGATSGTVTLDPSTTTTQPTFPIWSGVPEIYQEATFKVPGNTDRLQFNAAYTYTGQSSLLHVALFTPDGTYAGYSLPQGLGDYANIEVTAPQPGKWTAVFFTVADADGLGNGTSGAVPWTASFEDYKVVGDVDPGISVIPAGATRTVSFTVRTHTPADRDYSLVLGDSGVTVPVVVRTLVPTSSVTGGTFTGVLTGGNGRGAPAQTNTWQFNVPAGVHDVDASLTLASNPPAGFLPADQFIAYLIDPNGQIGGYDTNYTQGPSAEEFNPSVQLYVSQPVPGTWSLVVDWVQPLTGAVTSEPFTGAVRFNLVSTSSTLPNSGASTVSESAGGTFGVTVTNTGVAPMGLLVDARLAGSQTTYGLGDVFGSPLTQSLPGGNNTFFIPPQTSSISVQETATVAPTFDLSTYTGDPDLTPQLPGPGVTASLSPTSASLTYTPGSQVSPGLWFNSDAEIGPYAGVAPTGTETTTATATTETFDTTMFSPAVGDIASTLVLGEPGFAPYVLQPGQSVTLPVDVAPTGAVGTQVEGTLYVDSLTYGADFVSTIAGTPPFELNTLSAIPYHYTIGS